MPKTAQAQMLHSGKAEKRSQFGSSIFAAAQVKYNLVLYLHSPGDRPTGRPTDWLGLAWPNQVESNGLQSINRCRCNQKKEEEYENRMGQHALLLITNKVSHQVINGKSASKNRSENRTSFDLDQQNKQATTSQ